jgi:hypothetical protein
LLVFLFVSCCNVIGLVLLHHLLLFQLLNSYLVNCFSGFVQHLQTGRIYPLCPSTVRCAMLISLPPVTADYNKPLLPLSSLTVYLHRLWVTNCLHWQAFYGFLSNLLVSSNLQLMTSKLYLNTWKSKSSILGIQLGFQNHS